MNKKNYLLLIFVVFLLNSTWVSAQNLIQWTEIHSGIWKATAGEPEKVSLLKAAAATANETALNALPKVEFPLSKADIDIKVLDNKTYLRFPLDQEEQLFGLGLNFQTVNQRGRIMTLHVDHYGGKDNGRTHAPVPFYVSSKGYGVLIDAARYITVYAGTGVRTETKIRPFCTTGTPKKTGMHSLIPMWSKFWFRPKVPKYMFLADQRR